MPRIELKERGTLAVMQWIADNNAPSLCCQDFSYQGEPYLIVSDQAEADMTAHLVFNPLETWHEVNGMKRFTIARGGQAPYWYFYINDKFYFATLY